MDGSDRRAAGVAVIVAGVEAVLLIGAGDPALAGCAIIVAAATTGFLFYNTAPASLFMGDAGSYFLGFSIAMLALLSATRGVRVAALVLLLLPFLFDTSWTLLRRIARRERIWIAHREHLYQRLLIAGWSHRAVARRYYAWQTLAAVCAVIYQYSRGPMMSLAVASACLSAAAVLVTVRNAEGAAILTSTPSGSDVPS
jgi:UDP-N-acetylmuramyl pentapeptide phosphotransferase/UDP-N-acetylglucosamine-1-phosphate transferase